jgi:DNA-binding CsgD family transcriptional regulator
VLRVIVVGTDAERESIKARVFEARVATSSIAASLAHPGWKRPPIDVVAEFPTLSAAHASGIAADAILTAFRPAGGGIAEEALTPREVEVLELLAEGLPNKAIASRLGISDQTVKFHVSSICAKLPAANRTDAVRRAIRRGLITV